MDEQGSLEAAIAADNQFHHQLTQKADIVIDSTGKSPHIFCQELGARLELTLRTSLMLSVQSFSYKNGLPPAADMVFDMRFLQNPHWHTDLRQLTGREDAVRNVYVDPAFLPCAASDTAIRHKSRFSAAGAISDYHCFRMYRWPAPFGGSGMLVP